MCQPTDGRSDTVKYKIARDLKAFPGFYQEAETKLNVFRGDPAPITPITIISVKHRTKKARGNLNLEE